MIAKQVSVAIMNIHTGSGKTFNTLSNDDDNGCGCLLNQ